MRYADNPRIANQLTDRFPHPYTRASGEVFLARAAASDPTTIFAIDVDGTAIGGIGLHPQVDVWQKNAELGYWLAEPFWGRGIMTAAVRRIVQIGFDQLPVDRIFARLFGSNLGSQRVLDKAGFTLEARLTRTIWKNERYEDELIYGVRRG